MCWGDSCKAPWRSKSLKFFFSGHHTTPRIHAYTQKRVHIPHPITGFGCRFLWFSRNIWNADKPNYALSARSAAKGTPFPPFPHPLSQTPANSACHLPSAPVDSHPNRPALVLTLTQMVENVRNCAVFSSSNFKVPLSSLLTTRGVPHQWWVQPKTPRGAWEMDCEMFPNKPAVMLAKFPLKMSNSDDSF